jgi:hypothetical protein
MYGLTSRDSEYENCIICSEQHWSSAASGWDVGRDRLFDVLCTVRLLVLPHRAYHKTTQSHHRF